MTINAKPEEEEAHPTQLGVLRPVGHRQSLFEW